LDYNGARREKTSEVVIAALLPLPSWRP
jgi:hypothetical protein